MITELLIALGMLVIVFVGAWVVWSLVTGQRHRP